MNFIYRIYPFLLNKFTIFRKKVYTINMTACIYYILMYLSIFIICRVLSFKKLISIPVMNTILGLLNITMLFQEFNYHNGFFIFSSGMTIANSWVSEFKFKKQEKEINTLEIIEEAVNQLTTDIIDLSENEIVPELYPETVKIEFETDVQQAA